LLLLRLAKVPSKHISSVSVTPAAVANRNPPMQALYHHVSANLNLWLPGLEYLSL
jgi:hypothetical protein